MIKLQSREDSRRIAPPTPSSKFVERNEFLKLLTGKTRLVRADDRRGHIRGLLDPVLGRRFLIEEDKLFPKL